MSCVVLGMFNDEAKGNSLTMYSVASKYVIPTMQNTYHSSTQNKKELSVSFSQVYFNINFSSFSNDFTSLKASYIFAYTINTEG